MTKKNIELLAPAGNMECLIAAVRNGADAVYFGGGSFNARRGAANFTGDSLKEAIDFCRLRGVKTHITLNTLLFDRELAPALRFASELYSLRADAVIVQDLGLAALIREKLPDLTVHASTQMGIHSLDGLKYCEENGISRAVLARETPLAEIRRMHETSPVELEFFCHGALCMGFSGSCLYSSMAGERSGNRGTCAQPCRKNASVLRRRAGENEFALSTNDICMIDELPALIDAGVCSFKIEGRMKQPEYVATVTRIYRAALDGEKPGDASRKLFEIFNRGGFSTAHLHGDSVTTGHVGSAKPPKALIAEAHESVRRDRQTVPVSLFLSLPVGERAALTAVSGERAATAYGCICDTPQVPVSEERIKEQLKKLGGTPFFAESCLVSGEGFIPVSELNALRREAINGLSLGILGEPREEIPVSDSDAEAQIKPCGAAASPAVLYKRVRAEEDALLSEAELTGVDPAVPSAFDTRRLAESGKRFALILPNVIMTEGARAQYEKLLSSGAFCGVEINNISHIGMGAGLPVRIAGIGMNVTNSVSATKLLSSGFTHFMPSAELTRAQIAHLAEDLGSRMIVNVFGRTPLMQLMHCPVKEYRGCQGCRGNAGELTDGDGRRFPLENVRFKENGGSYCLVRLMNSAVTDIREAFASSGIAVFAVAETGAANGNEPITRGHWNRAVE